jgi:hypothetical protein
LITNINPFNAFAGAILFKHNDIADIMKNNSAGAFAANMVSEEAFDSGGFGITPLTPLV